MTAGAVMLRVNKYLLGLLACLWLAPSLAAIAPALVRLDGKPATLDAYRGKTVLVNFWATWCAPCRKEMPELNALSLKLDQGKAVVLGVAVDEAADVKSFLLKLPVKYPVITGDPDQLFKWTSQLGNITGGLPFSVLLDGTGKVIWVRQGELNFKELAPLLSKYMTAGKNSKK